MTTYTLHYVDTCLPDYFGGHHLPVVQVIVDDKSTCASVKEDLLSYMAIDHLENIDFDLYKKAVEDLFSTLKDMDEIWDSYLEPSDEYSDSVYSYFVIETIEED